MKLEQNHISRDWTILHEGRKFYVNFTESDGQTLALCNRDNWEVWEDTEGEIEELDIYIFKSDTAIKRRKAKENYMLKEKLIRFCIENWNNKFLHEINHELQEQKELLDAT